MEPFTGIGLILSLIQLFQHHRDKREAASTKEFYSWLLEHKFQDVKECISNNFALETEIANILKINHEELLLRISNVEEQLARILHSVDIFKGMVKTIAPSACLSKNQEEFLRAIVNSGNVSFQIVQLIGSYIECCGRYQIDLSRINSKFIIQSAEILTKYGFLMKEGKSYMLTEEGLEYITQLDNAGNSREN